MKALFIGHTYTDVTFVTDYLPTGDEKHIGEDYAFGVGGNAVIAAFTAAKLGADVDLITQTAPDRLGDVFLQRCAKSRIRTFTRTVKKSSLSLVLPNNGKRAIVRCRDNDYLDDFPKVRLKGYGAIHVDGHMEDAALYYLKEARREGILTSYDGGAVRESTKNILPFIDIAVVSEEFVADMKSNIENTLKYLHDQGVKVAAVTLGSKGVIFSTNDGVETLDSLPIKNVVDSTGAGDIFHGSYIYSYLENPSAPWREHFNFARTASAISVQTLGAEASIPKLSDIESLLPPLK